MAAALSPTTRNFSGLAESNCTVAFSPTASRTSPALTVNGHGLAPGVNAGIDRIISGQGDSGVLINALGVEVMVSSKRVPRTGWSMVATLPTDEAFAPIRTMQQRMQIATLLLTLLATGAMALLLRRQLAPLQSTAAQLTAQTDARQTLPIVRDDEIGVLIGAFNRLLATV